MSSEETALKGCATGERGLQPCLLLLSLAVLARTIYLLTFRPPLESYYLGLADSLIRAGVLGLDGRPSTAFEPGYPLFLAAAPLMFGERILLIQLTQPAAASTFTSAIRRDAFLTHLALRHIVADPLRTICDKLANVVYLMSPRLAPYRISASDTRVHIDENGTARVSGSVRRTSLEVWSYAAAAILLLAGTVAGVVCRRGVLHCDAVLWAIAPVFIAVNVRGARGSVGGKPMTAQEAL